MERSLQDAVAALPQPPTSVRAWLTAGEGRHVEFKSRPPAAAKLAKTCVALANSGGGVVLLGVDDRGSVCGCAAALDDIRGLVEQIRFLSRPPVPVAVEEHRHEGRRIVVLRVDGSLTPPYQVETRQGHVCYVRIGSRCQEAGPASRHQLRNGAAPEEPDPPAPLPPPLDRLLHRSHRIEAAEFARLRNISVRRARQLLLELVRRGQLSSYREGPHEYFG